MCCFPAQLLEMSIPPADKRESHHMSLRYPVTADPSVSSIVSDRSRKGSVMAQANRKLLILRRPGRSSGFWIEGIHRAADRLGVDCVAVDLASIWRRNQTNRAEVTRRMRLLVEQERIGAVVSYCCSGMMEFNAMREADGSPRGFFDALDVTHLMMWADHPQWAMGNIAFRPDLQPLLRSKNCHHFVSSKAAAREIKTVLGWSNVHAAMPAEDPDILAPANEAHAEYDIVAVIGTKPKLITETAPFLKQEQPDPHQIAAVIERKVLRQFASLWHRVAPTELQSSLAKLGARWARLRRDDETTASVYYLPDLQQEFPKEMGWLLSHPDAYRQAVRVLWTFGMWQRTFYLAYLARFFRVAAFGSDWSSLGLHGSPDWVPYHEQPAAYARGLLAINISEGHDEEGLTHKPFQIAASRAPMLHITRCGLADAFVPGVEVGVFDTPMRARTLVAELLADPERRSALAEAAHTRFLQDHTWERWLAHALGSAGLSIDAFRSRTTQAAA